MKSKKLVNKEYRERNKKKILEYKKSIQHLPQVRFLKYRHSAKKRGYSFELTKEEFIFIVASICHYCGSDQSIGVDRRDNTVGYTTENSVACCATCNRMKGIFGYDEFIQTCKMIASHRG